MPVRFGVCINSRNCNYSTALILPKLMENYTLLNSVIVQKVPWGFSKSTLYPKGPLTWNHFIFVTLRRKTWKCVSASSIYIFSVGSISISSMGKKKEKKKYQQPHTVIFFQYWWMAVQVNMTHIYCWPALQTRRTFAITFSNTRLKWKTLVA